MGLPLKKALALATIIDKANAQIGRAVGFLVVPIMVILLYGVVMRYIFNQPIFWGGQISLTLYIALAVLAGAYVFQEDFHVRVDVLYGRLSPKGKAKMDVATFIVFLLFLSLLTWYTIHMAWASIETGQTSRMYFKWPAWPSKVSLALACILVLLQGIARFIQDILIITGRRTES